MSTISIPAFHVSDQTIVEGSGEVFIQSRKDIGHAGMFLIKLNVHFNTGVIDPYPAGSLLIRTDLNDGSKGTFVATSIELVNSYGKVNPTFYITGRCKEEEAKDNPQGCRFWVIIVDNGRANKTDPTHLDTPDIAGFAIHDHNGDRIAYGTGPVKSGSGGFSGKAEF